MSTRRASSQQTPMVGASKQQSADAPASSAGVVRLDEGQPREWLGVPFDLMATGDRLMVIRMRFSAGVTAASHVHPHEQAGYVISGRYLQTLAGSTHELGPGDTYAIPGGIEHSMHALEGGEVIDVFTPPRDEFR